VFWGAKWDETEGKWLGKNVLGALWMQIREELGERKQKVA
jgi:predicted NAD-dependent protein-ADP-ribosyltransferase YbiA (DUF1768 family)